MPLSEHEERILAEIERKLAEEDPRFVQRARKTSVSDLRGRRLRWSIAGFVVGFVLLLGLTFDLVLGLVGFGVMLVSLVVGARAVADLGDEEGAALVDRLRRALRRETEDRER
jgi:hypothetical protein